MSGACGCLPATKAAYNSESSCMKTSIDQPSIMISCTTNSENVIVAPTRNRRARHKGAWLMSKELQEFLLNFQLHFSEQECLSSGTSCRRGGL